MRLVLEAWGIPGEQSTWEGGINQVLVLARESSDGTHSHSSRCPVQGGQLPSQTLYIRAELEQS